MPVNCYQVFGGLTDKYSNNQPNGRIDMTDTRNWAKETDCADCGQSEAGFKFQGTDSICAGCAPQYQPEDLEPAS